MAETVVSTATSGPQAESSGGFESIKQAAFDGLGAGIPAGSGQASMSGSSRKRKLKSTIRS